MNWARNTKWSMKNRELSLQESKRQTKERRDRGKNMIRPFTFDEEKILRDGLYHNNVKEENETSNN